MDKKNKKRKPAAKRKPTQQQRQSQVVNVVINKPVRKVGQTAASQQRRIPTILSINQPQPNISNPFSGIEERISQGVSAGMLTAAKQAASLSYNPNYSIGSVVQPQTVGSAAPTIITPTAAQATPQPAPPTVERKKNPEVNDLVAEMKAINAELNQPGIDQKDANIKMFKLTSLYDKFMAIPREERIGQGPGFQVKRRYDAFKKGKASASSS